MEIGELVGQGRTSHVYAYGTDSVIKVPHADVPTDWSRFEAALTRSVHAMGVAAPAVREVVDVDGRDAVVFERIDGPSMWQTMLAKPAQAAALARELAAIQKSLLAVGIPGGIPDLVDRLGRKINVASGLDERERNEALRLASDLPRGAALLHGDLHPGNVLMGKHGPVVIDWFDAAIGHPIADILRTSILISRSPAAPPPHLPGAPGQLLSDLHRSYLAEFQAELDMARHELSAWQAVVAAARLAEGAEVDEGTLVALWEARDDEVAAQSLLVAK